MKTTALAIPEDERLACNSGWQHAMLCCYNSLFLFKKNQKNNNKQTGNITISSNIEALLYTAESSRPGRRTRIPAAVYLVSISRVVDNSGLGLLIWGGREVEERSVQSRGRLGRSLDIKRGKTGNKSAGGRRGNAQHCCLRASVLSTAPLPTGGQRHKTKDIHRVPLKTIKHHWTQTIW